MIGSYEDKVMAGGTPPNPATLAVVARGYAFSVTLYSR